MKLSYKIALFISILLSIAYFAPAWGVFQSITNDPTGWQAGIDVNSTIVWFAVVTIGYGFLLLQTVLALFALLFSIKSKRPAFWLLLLPGILGILLGLIGLGLFAKYDAEWPASWPLIAVLIVPPSTAFVVGKLIRRAKVSDK